MADNPYQSPETLSLVEDELYTPKVFALGGRIGRLRYLAYAVVANILLFFVIGILMSILIPMVGTGSEAALGAQVVITILLYGISFFITFVLARRRLNDLNKSGWLSLLLLVPIVNFFMGLYLLFFPGTKGTNDFGPAPIANSNWLWLALLGPLFGVGILAAIAIPQYQAYVEKAQQYEQRNN